MRVVAGQARGRLLQGPPRGAEARPTSDRVREALFQILEPLTGVVVLDLFAGTGALGIEALSRGAAHSTFVERDRAMLRVLAKNLHDLGLEARATVVARDVLDALGGPLASAAAIDVALADPPWRTPDLEQAAVLTAIVPRLAPSGIVAFEHAARTTPPDVPGLSRTSTRRWGDTAVSFYVLGGAV